MDEFKSTQNTSEEERIINSESIENAENTDELKDDGIFSEESYQVISDAEKEAFFLADESDEKESKSKIPLFAIISILIAIIIAAAVFFIIKADKEKDSDKVTVTGEIEDYTADIIDGNLYINGVQVDSDDVGIDEEDLEEFVEDVNDGEVTIPSSVVDKYDITTMEYIDTNKFTTAATTKKTTTTTSTGVKPRKIYLANVSGKEYEVGQKGKIYWYFAPANTADNMKGINFISSNTNVVTVDHLGNFKAKKVGTATITVQSKVASGVKASIVVKVVEATTTRPLFTTTTGVDKPIPTIVPSIVTTSKETTTTSQNSDLIESLKFSSVSGINLSYSSTIYIGGSTKLPVVVTPSTCSVKDLDFESSNTSVCTVDSNGKVVGIGPGKATIKIQPKPGKGSVDAITATITVLPQ